MTAKPFKLLSMLLVVGIAVSCTTDPKISIKENTVHETSVAPISLDYVLGPGDGLEVTYFFGTQTMEREYTLQIGDVISVEFFYHTDNNKTVTIGPDGKITLARQGEIDAAGLTTRQLTEKITRLYGKVFKDPIVTITLIEFNQALKGFKDAVTSDRRGHSKFILIRPDGYASFFYLDQDVRVAGLTIPQLRDIVAEEYNRKFGGIAISLALENTNSNLVYVSGQVAKPDAYQLVQPTTVTQVLSKAGIIWENSDLSSVIVVSRDTEGRPVGRIVDVNKVIGEGNIGNDVLLRRFDVVFVPKNTITNVNVWINQYLSKVVPDWMRLSFIYSLKGSSGSLFD